MEDEENEALSRVISELEALHHDDPNTPSPFSEPSLLDLLSLLDGGGGGHPLWDHFAARKLPLSSLLCPLSAAMDSPSPRLSLLASRAYLSLLVSPSAPLYTLFTPLPFLSLLRSLRRALKPISSPSPAPAPPVDTSHDCRKTRRKRKAGRPRDAAAAAVLPADHQSDARDLLCQVLELLDSVLRRIRLDSSHDGLKSLIEAVAAILDASTGHHRLPDLCFRILYGLVSRPDHGDQMLSAVEVLRSLAPMILSPVKCPARASALGFLTRTMVPLCRDNDGVRKALVYLPRFLAMKAPEKSEPRALAVDSIMEIVRAMEGEDQIGFMQYTVKMTKGKTQLRLLAVDLIVALLTSLPDPLGLKDSSEIIDCQWGMKCLEALVQRCSDSVGGVRARALLDMAQVVGFLSGDEENHAQLHEIMGIGSAGFNELLRRRCVDEKAAVRKAALLLITKSMALIGRPIDEVLLKTVGSACADPLVSIRKAALAALSEVYRRFPDGRVISEWLHAVPPLIVDNETSIQEECETLFLELVLDRISQAGKVNLGTNATDLESLLPEGVLDLLKGICDGEVAPCIKKICASLGKKKKLKNSIASSLQNVITASESSWLRNSMPIEKWIAPPGAWQLLSEVSLFTPKAVDWEFLHHQWQLLDMVNLEEKGEALDRGELNSISWARDRVSLLQTISNVCLELPMGPAVDLAEKLFNRIENFNMHLSEVDAHIKALKTLCKRKETPEKGNALVLHWVHQLLSKALKIVDGYVSDVSEAEKAKSFLTPPQSGRRNGKDFLASKSMLQAVTAVFTVGSLVLYCPSADLQGIVPLLHTIITSRNSEPRPKKLAGLTVSFEEISPSLYNQSWVTLGKICLVDDKLAKRYIPLFVQELGRSNCAALRNNIMVMMADFCVRYTALVDCYIPKITKSLRDPCEIVRRQTFILLSRLLQRDYVKWKGVLFLRFLLSLVDDSEKIRCLADFLFGSILKVKAPLLAYNSFIEAILVLNDCHVHAGHSETQGGLHTETQLFSIRGTDERSRSQRMHIYVSLLKQMAPEHLLATSAKLCAEILAAASDGLLNVDDVTGQSVVQDTLQILACKEMRIHSNRGSDTTEMDDEGGDGGGGALLAARGKVVTQLAKKNLIQNAIPIFIELKRLLESQNSPLTGCLMECLRVLLKDYKNEIEEILVADKQLQKELIYDMQKYEAAKAKSTVKEAVANVQRSDSYCSPADRTATGIYARVSEKLGTGGKIASAVADAAARATVRSVLKEVNRTVATPPLRSMSVPKLKSVMGNAGVLSSNRPPDVLESLRRRQSFESDEEN
ncbi:condensin-2 complex subunit D3 [Phoenix dactylifera]|uniref:Condensin-2 complex subunit D3 n=1 Tax=Phoenix dactylifera TaxID=42345 RepID=A0A8B7CK22_PHODC|nr:condensin-2 complex subunit D3 [Phoenix dactylifera]